MSDTEDYNLEITEGKDIKVVENIHFELMEFVEREGLPLCEYLLPEDVERFLYKITKLSAKS